MSRRRDDDRYDAWGQEHSDPTPAEVEHMQDALGMVPNRSLPLAARRALEDRRRRGAQWHRSHCAICGRDLVAEEICLACGDAA